VPLCGPLEGERLDVRVSKVVVSDLRCEMAGCNIVGVESTLRGLLLQCCQQGAENDMKGEREDLWTDSVGVRRGGTKSWAALV
jgi:hypothetical protein